MASQVLPTSPISFPLPASYSMPLSLPGLPGILTLFMLTFMHWIFSSTFPFAWVTPDLFFFQSCLKYNFLTEAFLEPLDENQFSLGRQSFLGPCVPNCRPFFHPLFHPGHFSGLSMQLVILRGNIAMTIQEKSRLPYYFLEKAVGLCPCSSHLQDTSSRYGASIWTTTSPPGTWNNTALLIIMLFNGP